MTTPKTTTRKRPRNTLLEVAQAKSAAPVISDEVAASIAGLPVAAVTAQNEAPSPAPEPAPVQLALRKLMVVFDYVKTDGSRGTSRIFIEGVADLRTALDVQKMDAVVMQHGGQDYLSVMITNWKPLEG